MKTWGTSVYLGGGGVSNETSITSFNSYSLIEIKDMIVRVRKAEIAEGKPKRKLSPVSTYILDELIRKYFENDAPRGNTLQMIIIEDKQQHGI